MRRMLVKVFWVFGLAVSGGASAVEVQCDVEIRNQISAVFYVAQEVGFYCQQLNLDLQSQGFPHCTALCTDQVMRTIDRGTVDIVVKADNNGRSSGSSFSFGSSSSSSSSSSNSSSKIGLNLTITMSIPLGPTDVLTCTNPLTSPIVREFSQRLLAAPEMAGVVRRSCSQT